MKDTLGFMLMGDFPAPMLDPVINGQSFIEMVREIELPRWKEMGRPHMAGNYPGIPVLTALLPSRHFLDESHWCFAGRIAILACTCGWPSCAELYAKIEVGEEEVTWSEFGCRDTSRSYDALEPFRFDKQQYLEALQSLPTLKSPALERQQRERGELQRQKSQAVAEARIPWRNLAGRIRRLAELLPQVLDEAPGRSLNLFHLWLQEHEEKPDGYALFGALQVLLKIGEHNQCSEAFWREMISVGEQFQAQPPTRWP